MIFSLFRKNKSDQTVILRQYQALTEAARRPFFYQEANVPDTVIGRFEMLSVMMILYFKRTSKAPQTIRTIAQEVADAFFEDLDHSLRELGIGDHGVPKRLKKFTQMFYGRLESYGAALDADDAVVLDAALKRNMHPENSDSGLSMRSLADYMLAMHRSLKDLPDSVLAEGGAAALPYQE